MAELALKDTLLISIPESYEQQLKWIFTWVFDRLSNFTYQLECTKEKDVILSFNGKQLSLPQYFLGKIKDNRLDQECLPKLPLKEWVVDWPELEDRLVDGHLPILFGTAGYLQINKREYILNLDVLGTCFFLLTRYEELISSIRDKHNRFRAIDSLAFQAGFVERPLADEYIEVLFALMKKIWPDLDFVHKQGDFQISHDVDEPGLYAFKSISGLVKSIIANVIRGKLKKAVNIFIIRIGSRTRIHRKDPFNTFEWIMDRVEAAGSKSTFYFLAGRHDKVHDGEYDIDHPAIVELARNLADRGHQIGLHPSYLAAENFEILANEQLSLESLKEKALVESYSHGARMHYLRWFGPQTWQQLASRGIVHDASLGFADHIGFRSGTCHPYLAFDLRDNCIIPILVLPLTVMEVTVIDDVYMGLGTGEVAFYRIDRIRNACKKVNGVFTLLWHNSRLVEYSEKKLFQRIIETM